MKPFIFNADLVDPVDVARRDYMEFLKWLLKTLIAYRGNLKRKTELEFQVKWFGYDETHNSWEPYVIPVIQINFMFSFAKTICCSWFLKNFAKKLHTVNSLVSFEDFLSVLSLQLTYLLVFGRWWSVRIWQHYSVWATCMLIIANSEWRLCLQSILFPTFLHFTKFYIRGCNFQKKSGSGYCNCTSSRTPFLDY